MKITATRRWNFSLTLVICIGLAYAAGRSSSPTALPGLISKLWNWERKPSQPHLETAALKKGPAGFDFTRIGHSGMALARQDAVWQASGSEADGTQWKCLRDNVTGLWWEGKTRGDTEGVLDLRHVSRTYSWSEAVDYVEAVNAAGLCGFSDWRLPAVSELSRLTSINKGGATIDTQQFPNTTATGYWTATAYPHRDNYVWYVYFAGAGDSFGDAPSANYAVRLVRSDL
ncbi:MAG: DUF1566 domain-containing protein [Rhodoferax sp.]|nr:DUF1566 domain-containing protein [Rhodoferax sp.]